MTGAGKLEHARRDTSGGEAPNRETYHEHAEYGTSIERLLSPRSIAVVGASPSGRASVVLENLVNLSYPGSVVCVNPKYDEVLGYPCVPSLTEVPFAPDVVYVGLATERVVDSVEAAAKIGARGAVIPAFGFADQGEEGRERQRRLEEIAVAAKMAVVGPNCQGFINFTEPVALYTPGVDPSYRAGRVAVISESGSVLMALVNSKRGVRWSHAVSSGNEAVTDAADFARAFVDSEDVDVVCAYLETVRRPKAFFDVCEHARAKHKVVVVCPLGRSKAAGANALAHSGALALPYDLLTSALKDAGAIVVTGVNQLLETAVALSSSRAPTSNRVALMAASGGQIGLLLDSLETSGLQAAELSAPTKDALTGLLPPFLKAQNPLDWWGVDDPESTVPEMATVLGADPGVDIVVQVASFSFGPIGDYDRASRAMRSAREVAGSTDEAVFSVLSEVAGTPPAEEVERGLEDGVVVLSGFAEGLRALGHLVQASEPLAPRRPRSNELFDVASSWRLGGSRVLGGSSALGVMQAAGFDVVRHLVVTSVDEAAAAATKLGYPVVLKIADDEVAHKTEVGGVVLNVETEASLRASAEDLLRRGSALMVQEQVRGGHELILGIKAEPPLGSFVLAGLGGIWAEIVRDVQVRPVGLREGTAAEMIRSLRAFEVLRGARSGERASIEHIVGAVERLDQLAIALGEDVDSIDVNPLVVLPDRAIVVDALFVRTATTSSPSAVP